MKQAFHQQAQILQIHQPIAGLLSAHACSEYCGHHEFVPVKCSSSLAYMLVILFAGLGAFSKNRSCCFLCVLDTSICCVCAVRGDEASASHRLDEAFICKQIRESQLANDLASTFSEKVGKYH